MLSGQKRWVKGDRKFFLSWVYLVLRNFLFATLSVSKPMMLTCSYLLVNLLLVLDLGQGSQHLFALEGIDVLDQLVCRVQSVLIIFALSSHIIFIFKRISL